MLSVKLLRSLVSGETIINNPCYFNHHKTHDDNDAHKNTHTHDEYDADDDHDDNDDDDAHLIRTQIQPTNKKPSSKTHQKFKRKMPLLYFSPTKELISDTFRLATIARDIGMDFYPSPSLSHLFFSWPARQAEGKMCAVLPVTQRAVVGSEEGKIYGTTTMYSPISPLSTMSSNNRPSVSSTSTTTTTNTTCSSSVSVIPNDAVPLPFPTLSTSSSISLLRYFVSLSKGLFKLVFVEVDRFHDYGNCNYGGNFGIRGDCEKGVKLVSRVSGKVVDSMEEFSRVLAANGWALFRSPESKKKSVAAAAEEGLDLVFMFRKQDFNRVRVQVRVEKMIHGGGGGECRVRELRLPTLDFKGGVPLRILQYILLMTDDVFYLA